MAQCPLPCGNTQLSVNGACEAEINPATILTGNLDATCDYRVIITDLDDNLIAESITFGGLLIHPTISISDGTNFKASVAYTDVDGDEFSCWSYLTLEDKLSPGVICLDDVTVACTKEHSDDLMTETNQCHSADDTSDADAAAGVYEFSIDVSNDAFPWEIITSAELNMGITFSGIASPFDLTLTGPDGVTYDAVYSPSNGIAEMDLIGLQTTDAMINGTWTVSILTADVGSISTALFCIESTSIFVDSPDIVDNCGDATVEFLSDDLNDVLHVVLQFAITNLQ